MREEESKERERDRQREREGGRERQNNQWRVVFGAEGARAPPVFFL